MRGLDLIDQLGAIKQKIAEAGSQAAFARQLGVAPQFVSLVLNAQRPPTDAMLEAAGLRRVVVRVNQ